MALELVSEGGRIKQGALAKQSGRLSAALDQDDLDALETPPARRLVPDETGWTDAYTDFLEHVQSAREEKTLAYYRTHIGQLIRWVSARGVTLASFRVKDLRQYLIYRGGHDGEEAASRTAPALGVAGVRTGVGDTTRQHDAASAKVFLTWCSEQGYLDTNPLQGYKVKKAAIPYKAVPSEEEVRLLVAAVERRWDPSQNHNAAYVDPAKRKFMIARQAAIIYGLSDTAMRIGEMLALTMDDYLPKEKILVVTESKTDEPREVPYSTEFQAHLTRWLDVRARILKRNPQIKTNLLFFSETGRKLRVDGFCRAFRGYVEYAGLRRYTLHSLRHRAITRFAQVNPKAAGDIAGHNDPRVTARYTHFDRETLRAVHDKAQEATRPVKADDMLVSKRVTKRRII